MFTEVSKLTGQRGGVSSGRTTRGGGESRENKNARFDDINCPIVLVAFFVSGHIM